MINSSDVPSLTTEKNDSKSLFSLLEERDEETFSQRCAENRDRLDKDTGQIKLTYLQLACVYGLSTSWEWVSMHSEDLNCTSYPDRSSPIIQRSVEDRNRLDEDTGQSTLTYLQLACLYGLTKAVDALLTNGADPNCTAQSDQRSPIMIAAREGHYDIVKMLAQHKNVVWMNSAATKSTLLHVLLWGMCDARDRGDSHFVLEKCVSCIKLLLKDYAFIKFLDINAHDEDGFTALHLALKLQEKSIILSLLKRGAYIGSRCNRGDAAISLMNADVFEEYLNKCIYTHGKSIGEDYQIIYNYSVLSPWSVYLDKQGVHQGNDALVLETEPLIEISRMPELRHLLKHPVLASFLHVKWFTVSIYFWINFTFYLTFWLCLTLHTLITHSNSENQHLEWWTWCPSIVLCGLLGLREFFTFCILPTRYMSDVENLLDISLLVSNLYVLFVEVIAGVTEVIGVAAIALLLTWAKMVLLINRHPSLSWNIEMYKKVCTSFVKLLALWSLLILAFALSFYLLFKGDKHRICPQKKDCMANNNCSGYWNSSVKPPEPEATRGGARDNNCTRKNAEDVPKFFEKMETSFFKVILMMTGEFDTSSIPFNCHKGFSHVIFILFAFLVSIVLFNLMSGLAVNDTQAIINDAKIVGYAALAKQIAYIEIIFNRLQTFVTFLSSMTSNPTIKGMLTIGCEIILFPYNLLHVIVLPNQSNRVVFPNPFMRLDQTQYPVQKQRRFRSILDSNGKSSLRIVPEIINATKKILHERKSKTEENEHSSNSLDRYSEKLENCSEKLETYSGKLEEYGSRLTLLELTTNRKLDTVIELLRQRN